MKDITLLVVEPDEHYMETVAHPAAEQGLVADVKVADRGTFDQVLNLLDKTKLIIAKGMLETADFLKLILNYNNKSKELIADPENGCLSHCFVVQGIGGADPKPMILTDAAINIAPDAERKLKIVKNAIELARDMLGLARPVVSLLTPSGKLNPKIQSSVDGDFVIRALANENAEVRLDQLDTAVSENARKVKKLDGKAADVVVADNLGEGNIVYKSYSIFGNGDGAGLVCGTTVPIVLNSRSDAPTSKLMSIKYALRLLENR